MKSLSCKVCCRLKLLCYLVRVKEIVVDGKRESWWFQCKIIFDNLTVANRKKLGLTLKIRNKYHYSVVSPNDPDFKECFRCGRCCLFYRPECAAENMTIENGLSTCKIYNTADFPQECKDYFCNAEEFFAAGDIDTKETVIFSKNIGPVDQDKAKVLIIRKIETEISRYQKLLKQKTSQSIIITGDKFEN